MNRIVLRRLRLLPLLLLFVPLAGCGGDGANRVSGTVKFKGAPVPKGKIYFMPDTAKGNTGATGYADITDGAFDTSSSGGRGAVKGAVIVAIEGWDPSQTAKPVKGDTSGETTVQMLFLRYETNLEVTGATTKDFEVPAEAAKGPKPPAGTPTVVP
jgi:hypothetical protein